MRNTYNISRLRARIFGALPRPLSPVGESALEAFLSLPAVSTWSPDRLGLIELSFVFDIGLPLALIGENRSLTVHAMRVGDAARDGRYPQADQWRVVHVAALLCHWGAAVEFVPEPAAASPQLEVRLPGGGSLDVVVAHAHLLTAVDAEQQNLLHGRGPRPRLLAIDARGSRGTHEAIVAACSDDFGDACHVAGVLSFEPRFWVGVEQKEWLHLARLNPRAATPAPAELVGGTDSRRRALRLALSL